MNVYGQLKQKVYDLLEPRQPISEANIRMLIAPMLKTALYSPDIIELERHRRQTIFVHDDMMRGGQLHDYIIEKSITGRWPTHAAFTDEHFFMWKKSLGEDSYPVALDRDVTGFYRGDRLEPARIRGEIYSIRPSQFRLLDTLKENGYAFTRRRVTLTIPRYKVRYGVGKDGRNHSLPTLQEANSRIEAWMYVGNYDYWNDQLAGVLPSSPVPLIEDHAREWLKKYYMHKNE